MTADVLVLTVPTPRGYATVNSLGADGFRGGRKTVAFREHFCNVRDAAAAEMARVGWQTAMYLVDVTIVRYVAHRGRVDAQNLAKSDLDAMEPSRAPRYDNDLRAHGHPFPGVYVDDSLVVPTPRVEYDPAGPERIVIVCRRMFPPAILSDAPRRGQRARTSATTATTTRDAPVVPPPRTAAPSAQPREPFALLDGKPIARDKALEMIRGSR